MDEIVFHSADGFAPRYKAPTGETYYIADHHETNGSYTYSLEVKTKKPLVQDFVNERTALQYVLNLTNGKSCPWQHLSDGDDAYQIRGILHVVHGMSVTTFYDNDYINGPFESYADCLAYAKEYIKNKIITQQLPLEALAETVTLSQAADLKIIQKRNDPERER